MFVAIAGLAAAPVSDDGTPATKQAAMVYALQLLEGMDGHPESVKLLLLIDNQLELVPQEDYAIGLAMPLGVPAPAGIPDLDRLRR